MLREARYTPLSARTLFAFNEHTAMYQRNRSPPAQRFWFLYFRVVFIFHHDYTALLPRFLAQLLEN